MWSEWFDGLIDEVRVYNRALSQAEVQSDLASPIASGQTPPPSDTSPPTVPAGLHPTAVTATSVSLAWTASTDNAGVTGYTTYSNGASAGTSTGASFTVGGLTCGTSYSLAVDAYDAAGNRSAKARL